MALHTPPSALSACTTRAIRRAAERAFRTLGLRDFARLDGFVIAAASPLAKQILRASGGSASEGAEDVVVFVDVNIVSGMEQTSFMFAQAAEARKRDCTPCGRFVLESPGATLAGAHDAKLSRSATSRFAPVPTGGSVARASRLAPALPRLQPCREALSSLPRPPSTLQGWGGQARACVACRGPPHRARHLRRRGEPLFHSTRAAVFASPQTLRVCIGRPRYDNRDRDCPLCCRAPSARFRS